MSGEDISVFIAMVIPRGNILLLTKSTKFLTFKMITSSHKNIWNYFT